MRSGEKKNRINKKRIVIAIVCVLLIAAVALTLYFLLFRGKNADRSNETDPVARGVLTVRALDVGQGDSILITTAESKNILIDTGYYFPDNTMLNLLIRYGVDEIEYMVLTHPHGDHIGNAKKVLQNFKTKNVIMINMVGASYSYGELLDELEKQKDINVIEGKAGYTFNVSGAEFRILSPQTLSEDINESSIVMRMTYGANSMIFMADVGEVTEQWLMRNYTASELRSDVIKIGHHGSKYSSTRAFLRTVSPEYAVISCGKDNDYGHPHSRVTNTLISLGIKTLRTDIEGTVSFYFYGDHVSTEPPR